MPSDIPQTEFGEELPKEVYGNTIVVECENERKQLHRATQDAFTWHCRRAAHLGGDNNHPQPRPTSPPESVSDC